MRRRIEDDNVCFCADRQPPLCRPLAKYFGRPAGDFAERLNQGYVVLGRPLQRQRKQRFERTGAGFGFAERQQLVVLADRRVIRADDVDRAVGEPRNDRVAIARAAQRWIESEIRIEVADVDVDQMHMMNGNVGGDRQTLSLGLPHQFNPFARRQAADMNLRTGRALQFEDRVQRDRFGDDRHRRQSQPAGDRAGTRYTLAGQRVFDRAQPDRQLEGLRVSHRLQQYRVVVRQAARLHECDASGFRQCLDLGQCFALQFRRQRA